MKNKSADDKLLFWGLFNIISPFPFLFFTATWAVLIMLLFRLDDSNVIANILAFLPLIACPIFCIWGFLFGRKHRTDQPKRGKLCVWLSVGGFIEYILLFLMVAYLGSIG